MVSGSEWHRAPWRSRREPGHREDWGGQRGSRRTREGDAFTSGGFRMEGPQRLVAGHGGARGFLSVPQAPSSPGVGAALAATQTREAGAVTAGGGRR